MNNQEKSWLVFWMIACAGMGGMLYGYDIGVITGALLFIRHSISMSTSQMGIIVGAVLTGSLIGTLITGNLADRYGRRRMIMLSCIVFIVGILQIILATSFMSLLLARLLLGVGVGMVSVTVPLYLAEAAPAKIRGRSVSIFQLFLTFGILLAYCVDLAFTPSGDWRAMFAMILIPATLLLITMYILPETPRWLFANGQKQRALDILQKTHAPYEINAEIKSITTQLAKESASFKTLFSKELLLPLMIAVFIAISNQLTGVNCILQYAPIILKRAGVDTHVIMMMGTVGIGLMQFIATLIATSLVDKVGRKKLLIIGTGTMVLADIFLACTTTYLGHTNHQALLSFSGLVIYIIAYAIGPGIVVWLAISELLPTKVRGRAIAICLFANSLAAALLASLFMNIIDTLGLAGTFWFFTLCTLFYCLVAIYGLPETKGKTLEQIQQHFQKHRVSD